MPEHGIQHFNGASDGNSLQAGLFAVLGDPNESNRCKSGPQHASAFQYPTDSRNCERGPERPMKSLRQSGLSRLDDNIDFESLQRALLCAASRLYGLLLGSSAIVSASVTCH